VTEPNLEQDRYFPSTSWTLLFEARGADARASDARAEFARRYYRPVLNYFAALLRDRGEAEELTQSFFAKLAASDNLIAQADRSRGRFRHYLKRCISNFWKSELRHRGQLKRKAEDEVRPDAWSGSGWDRLGLAAPDSPEAAFHNAWVRGLLDEALCRVRAVCEQKDQVQHYQLFVGMYLCDESEPPTWRALGAAFGLEEKMARSRTETVARHFRGELRSMLREEVESDESVDEEIAALLALL